MFRHSHNCPYFQSGDMMSDMKIYERSLGKALYCNREVFTFLFGYMGISAFSSRLAVARRLFPYMRTYAFGSRLLLQLGGFYFFSRVLCGYSFLVGISLAYFFQRVSREIPSDLVWQLWGRRPFEQKISTVNIKGRGKKQRKKWAEPPSKFEWAKLFLSGNMTFLQFPIKSAIVGALILLLFAPLLFLPTQNKCWRIFPDNPF